MRPTPGGVGAVRRGSGSRTRVGRARQVRRSLPVVGVIGLFAASMGPGATAGSPFDRVEILAPAFLERAPAPVAAEVGPKAVALRKPAAPAAPPGTTQPPASTSSSTATTAAAAGERAIVAPRAVPFTRPGARTTPIPQLPKAGGVWAVIVGIDDYPGTAADLHAASADARNVDLALARYGVPPERRLVLLDANATSTHILEGLAWMTGSAAADATVVFFYSGHVRQVMGDPDGDGEAVDEAIVAADGQHVFDGEIRDIFRSLEARSGWIGIAACYGSGFDDALLPGHVLTAAAAETDLAYENSALGYSYLVEYMVRQAMVEGKAPNSVQEAFGWARAQIASDYPNRLPVMVDRSQAPVVLRIPPAASPPVHSASAEPRREPQGQQAPPAKRERPAREEPPADDQEGPSPCVEVLGVSACSGSESRYRGPVRYI